MRYSTIILCVLFLSGCSTLTKLGEIEGTGKTGEYLRAVEAMRVGLGGKPNNNSVAAVINRSVGESAALEESLDSTTTSNVGQRIERFGYILENITQ